MEWVGSDDERKQSKYFQITKNSSERFSTRFAESIRDLENFKALDSISSVAVENTHSQKVLLALWCFFSSVVFVCCLCWSVYMCWCDAMGKVLRKIIFKLSHIFPTTAVFFSSSHHAKCLIVCVWLSTSTKWWGLQSNIKNIFCASLLSLYFREFF